jgi:cell division protein FtsB
MPDRDVPSASTPFLRPTPPAARLARGSLPWLLAVLVLLLALGLLGGEHGLLQYLQLAGQRDALAAEQARLEERTAALEARLEALRTDPFALEKLARERYNLRRPGEEVIVVVPADQAGPGARTRP